MCGMRRKSAGMCMGLRVLFVTFFCLGCMVTHAAKQKNPFAKVPAERQDALAKRLDAYVQADRSRNWNKLYDLVSETGKAQVNRQTFLTRMKLAHGTQFANSPDLLEFRTDRTEQAEKGEWDIYGCGKASREGQIYNGIAVVHAVFEHNDWFFTGWSFTEFPNEPCKTLSDPDWKPDNP